MRKTMRTVLAVAALGLFIPSGTRAQTPIVLPAISAASCAPAMSKQTYTDSTGKNVTVINNVKAGEACSYTATVVAAGVYKLSVLAATTNPTGAAMHLEMPRGTNVSGALSFPTSECCVGSTPTHFYSRDGAKTFSLSSGAVSFTLVVDATGGAAAGTGAHVNIETLTLTQVAPAVTVSLSAAPPSIVASSASLLSWTSTGAASVSIDNSVGTVAPVAAGSYSVTPSVTTTYVATATGPGGSASSSATVTVTAPTDATPPLVRVMAPADGATVSGTISVVVSASDDSGIVASVQILVDGVPLGLAQTVEPYLAILDAAAFKPGAHVITATAVDGSGNSATSAPANITVAGEGFAITLVYDDGTPYATGGTLTVQEDVGTPGAPVWQTDITAAVDSAGHLAFRWPAATGKVYVVVLTNATGTVLWQTGTQLTPAQVPTSFSGVTATMQFSKATGAWLGFSNFSISY
jgi:hypothetical protein